MLQNPTNQTLFLSTDLLNLTSSFSKSVCRCSLIFGRKKQMPRQAGVWGRGQGGGMVPTHHSLWLRACAWQRGAYMMYTFSAWEKWKTSLVLGQTTLSS